MTKKDYVALAAALKLGNEITDDQGWDNRTYPVAVADVLQADNPDFNRATFLTACGVASVAWVMWPEGPT